jgi:hypothetical protein
MTYTIPDGSLKRDRAIRFGRALDRAMRRRRVGRRTLAEAIGASDTSVTYWRTGRIYCSPGCQRVAEKMRVGSTIDKRAAVAEKRLTLHVRAVGAFCLSCSPDGCTEPTCELRAVSPVPLALDDVHVGRAVSRGTGRRDPARVAASTAATWAGYTPEQRAARVARMREARHGPVAAALGEQP